MNSDVVLFCAGMILGGLIVGISVWLSMREWFQDGRLPWEKRE